MPTKSTIEISSASEFQKKIGLDEPLTLEWREGQIIEATGDKLDALKAEMAGKAASEKQKLAVAFIQANEKKEAEKDLATQIGDDVSTGLKEKLVKSGVVVGAIGAGTALAHAASAKIEESTGLKLNLWGKVQSWAREELKTAENPLWKWVLGLIAGVKGDGKNDTSEKDGNADAEKKRTEAEKEKKDASVSLVVAGLLKFSPVVGREPLYKDPKHVISSVLEDKGVLAKSYTELQAIHAKYSKEKPQGIEKDLGLPVIDGRSSLTMYLALQLIVSDERFMRMFQGPSARDTWKSEPLGKLLQIVSTDMSTLTTLSRIKDPTELQTLFESSADLITMSEDGELQGDMRQRFAALQERKGEYKGKITPRVLKLIFLQGGNTTDALMKEQGYTEAEMTFVRELQAYGARLPSTLMRDPTLSLGVGIDTGYRTKSLTLKEVFTFFLLTEGATDFSTLGGFSKFQAYRLVNKTLSDNGRSSVLAGEYKNAVMQEFAKASLGASTKLPEDVRIAFDTITGGMKNMVTNYVTNTFGQLGGAMKDPKVAAIVVAGVIAFLYIGRAAMLSKAVLAGIIATIVGISGFAMASDTKRSLEAAQKSLEK